MTRKENLLAASLLKMTAEKYSNFGCNDLDDHHFKMWKKEEKEEFAKEFWNWLDPSVEECPSVYGIPDDFLMEFISQKIKSE